jgi:hypothetical protein
MLCKFSNEWSTTPHTPAEFIESTYRSRRWDFVHTVKVLLTANEIAENLTNSSGIPPKLYPYECHWKNHNFESLRIKIYASWKLEISSFQGFLQICNMFNGSFRGEFQYSQILALKFEFWSNLVFNLVLKFELFNNSNLSTKQSLLQVMHSNFGTKTVWNSNLSTKITFSRTTICKFESLEQLFKQF